MHADTATYLHPDDYPATLALLAALFDRKVTSDPVGLQDIGYELASGGAWVDWDRLATSSLSSTEKAVVHIARGCAILERAGGPVPRLTVPIREAITAVTPMSADDIAFFDQLADDQ